MKAETKKEKLYSSIRDVAKRAGVSITTVSRVINHPEMTSKAVQEKVREAIDALNYSVDLVSTASINKRNKTIAFFVLDITNPFYTLLMQAFLQLSYEKNFSLIICETPDRESEKKQFDYCKSIRVDGIVYSANFADETVLLENTTNIPVVLIDHDPFPDYQAYSIWSDTEKAVRSLLNYLCHLNHKKIAFIDCSKTSSMTKRFDAYKKLLPEYGIEFNEEYAHHSDHFDEKAGFEAFDKFVSLSEPPTAVIGASDQIAHGFIVRALSLGMRIPEDFSVCGIDGIGSMYYPEITSVGQRFKQIALSSYSYINSSSDYSAPFTEIIDVDFKVGQTCRSLT